MKKRIVLVTSILTLALVSLSCAQKKNETKNDMNEIPDSKLELATFGSGCFWCTEAVFQNLKGVYKVESGYTGGKVKNPSYKEVCSGLTGHAEVIQLQYDPTQITFPELLEIFWKTHDPTTLNKQGADEGTQYRSAIFYHTDEQKRLAEEYKKKLDEAGAFDDPIVTEITPASVFYKAENYHQNYYNLNGNAPYCSYVIRPKLEKFKKAFAEKLK
jgi:peptide-methionine (S)-S-oxide reductase